MLIYRNAEVVNGQRKFGNRWSKVFGSRGPFVEPDLSGRNIRHELLRRCFHELHIVLVPVIINWFKIQRLRLQKETKTQSYHNDKQNSWFIRNAFSKIESLLHVAKDWAKYGRRNQDRNLMTFICRLTLHQSYLMNVSYPHASHESRSSLRWYLRVVNEGEFLDRARQWFGVGE